MHILTNVCGHPASSHLRPKVQKMSKEKKREQNTIIHSHLILTMQTWAIIQIRDLCFSHKLYWTI